MIRVDDDFSGFRVHVKEHILPFACRFIEIFGSDTFRRVFPRIAEFSVIGDADVDPGVQIVSIPDTDFIRRCLPVSVFCGLRAGGPDADIHLVFRIIEQKRR